jgi:hypothetical protein
MDAPSSGYSAIPMLGDSPRRQLHGVFGVDQRATDQDEFVTAEAGYGVGGPRHGTQSPSHLLQQFISRPVAQRVIDELETVEIANHECK